MSWDYSILLEKLVITFMGGNMKNKIKIFINTLITVQIDIITV